MKKSTLILLLTLLPLSSFAQFSDNETESTSSCVSFTRTMSYNKKASLRSRDTTNNKEVSSLQELLVDNNLLIEDSTGKKVKTTNASTWDTKGIFGINTKKAVQDFQKMSITSVDIAKIDTKSLSDTTIREQLATAHFILNDTGNVGKYTRLKLSYMQGCTNGVVASASSVQSSQVVNGVGVSSAISSQQTAPSIPVDIPSTCFGRSVVSRIADDGISQAAGAVYASGFPFYNVGKNIMHVIRFKTDIAGSVVVFDSGKGKTGYTFTSFISENPCDYTTAHEKNLVHSAGYFSGIHYIPVLNETQALRISKQPTDEFMEWTYRITKNNAYYLKPDTYYYYHVVNVNPSSQEIKTNEQLSKKEDFCRLPTDPVNTNYCAGALSVKLYPKLDKNYIIPEVLIEENPNLLPFPWIIEGKEYKNFVEVEAYYKGKSKAVKVDDYLVIHGWPPQIKGSSAKNK